jgi:hypothetical protein
MLTTRLYGSYVLANRVIGISPPTLHMRRLNVTEPFIAAPEWTPAFTIDLDRISALAFADLQVKFKQWCEDHPSVPLELATGWHEITPEMAEQMLCHNARNRKVSLVAVKKYAQAMLAGNWKRTGQPILRNERGENEDGQHRLWASYLSQTSFPTFIVADVPDEEDLFAYIDDIKARSAADALYTSGLNGLSGTIATTITLAHRYEHDALSVMQKQPKLMSLTKKAVLDFARDHQDLSEAAHTLKTSYASAIKVIVDKSVAAFFAWKVLALYDAIVLGNFLEPLGSGANLADDDPILALRNRLFSSNRADLSKPHILALLIKGFNMHVTGQKIGKKGLHLRDNEKFPRFEDVIQPQADAAE